MLHYYLEKLTKLQKQTGNQQMNPASLTRPTPTNLVQDVKSPVQPAAMPVPVKAEVVNPIPVKDQALANNQPLPTAAQPSAPKNLDSILKEVNKDVKKIDEPKKSSFSLSSLKSANLILPVIVAVLAVAILIAATVLAFRPSADRVRTRATTQAGT